MYANEWSNLHDHKINETKAGLSTAGRWSMFDESHVTACMKPAPSYGEQVAAYKAQQPKQSME